MSKHYVIPCPGCYEDPVFRSSAKKGFTWDLWCVCNACKKCGPIVTVATNPNLRPAQIQAETAWNNAVLQNEDLAI